MKTKSQLLDELLVLQARRGDKEALEQLVMKWHKKLIYQSQFRTKNHEQSEDIVQDVWQWVIGNHHKLHDISNFGSWIRTIVDRRSIDWLRRQKRSVEVNQEEDLYGNFETSNSGDHDPIDTIESPAEHALKRMEEAIKRLPAENKLILSLYYHESHSLESISKILGIPKGTVKSRLFHSREKLKKLLNN